MKLIEIARFTRHVAEMSAFYRQLLGVAPVAESPDMAIFMNGDVKIFIHKLYEPGENDLPPEDHIAFSAPDVDFAVAELSRKGIIVEVLPKDYYWGRSAYLRDPDGQLIEITKGAA